MPAVDWDQLTDFALELADAAALRIMPFFRNANRVDVKSAAVWDPVTEADRAGEEAIRRLIEARFPEHGILGEELGSKETRSPFTWILDPIDGTRAFICGMPTWATLIGLIYQGKPVLGVMHQPFVGETFYGNPGGSWSRHRGKSLKLAVRPVRPLAESILTTTAPELYSYFFCVLAAGQTDIAMDAHMETYDIAPLIPIIEGAGGVVSTWTSGDPTPGGNVVAASSRILLDEALAVIGGRNADE
jgi:fructose-1,6-bisphosphatase/inositol monophosphatase family enzyme